MHIHIHTSPALFEILGPKDNWVTSLTFLGHVTSLVTWPFDSPYPISYWCSIVTEPLSPSIFETFSSKAPVQCKLSLGMRDITWPVPPMQNLGTYFSFSPPHCLFTMALSLGSEGVFAPETLNVKGKIERKLSKNMSNFDILVGLVGRGYKTFRLLVQKAHPCANPRRLSHFAWKLVRGSDLQVGSGKK